jgi:hypothetical protein
MSQAPDSKPSGPSAEEFWAEEDERSKSMDDFLRENKMGGFDPKYADAGLDTDDEDEDDESDDTNDDGDATRPNKDPKRQDLPS